MNKSSSELRSEQVDVLTELRIDGGHLCDVSTVSTGFSESSNRQFHRYDAKFFSWKWKIDIFAVWSVAL